MTADGHITSIPYICLVVYNITMHENTKILDENDNENNEIEENLAKFLLFVLTFVLLPMFVIISVFFNQGSTCHILDLSQADLELKSIEMCSQTLKKSLMKFPSAFESEYEHYLSVMFRNSSQIRLFDARIPATSNFLDAKGV